MRGFEDGDWYLMGSLCFEGLIGNEVEGVYDSRISFVVIRELLTTSFLLFGGQDNV